MSHVKRFLTFGTRLLTAALRIDAPSGSPIGGGRAGAAPGSGMPLATGKVAA